MGVAKWGVMGLVALFASAPGWTGATAAAPPPSEWESRASWSEVVAALPKLRDWNAMFRGAMRCAVEDSGELSKCRVILETPVGMGVGSGLLSLAPKYRRKPPGAKGAREVVVAEGWAPFDTAGDWSRRPTSNDLRTVFPTEAFKKGISGSATIQCTATVQGALTDCLAIAESPAGMGFGSAAIALTPQFTMRPAIWKGQPTPSIISIPIGFKLFGPAPAAEGKRVVPPNLPWAEAPTYAEVAAAYPKKARAERTAGRATIACSMTREGRLTNCEAISVNPRNYGFDTAAKALAKSFRLQVTTPADVSAVRDLMVHLPFTFDPAMLDAAEPVVGKPNWAALPTGDAIVSAFEATKAKGTVRAQLRCIVQPGGGLGSCTVASEQPAGAGIAAAALTLVSSFKVTTWTAEGLPTVGGVIVVPLRYEPDGPPPASPPPAGH